MKPAANPSRSVTAVAAAAFFMLACAHTALAESIRIGGTGAALGTMARIADAFTKAHPEHSVKVFPSLGSSGGLKALKSGELDLAVTARDVNSAERESGLVAHRYGVTAFVFVSNSKAPVQPLSKDAIAAIYSGKTAAWPNGQPIRLVLRPLQETDTRLLATISPAIEAAVNAAHAKSGMTVAVTDTEAADLVEKTPYAFGTATLALLLSEARSVNILPVDGVLPSQQTLADGSYRYTKNMYAVTRAAPSRGAAQFVDFLRSPAGIDILKKTGHRPSQP